jgi:hypothetical protein
MADMTKASLNLIAKQIGNQQAFPDNGYEPGMNYYQWMVGQALSTTTLEDGPLD